METKINYRMHTPLVTVTSRLLSDGYVGGMGLTDTAIVFEGPEPQSIALNQIRSVERHPNLKSGVLFIRTTDGKTYSVMNGNLNDRATISNDKAADFVTS